MNDRRTNKRLKPTEIPEEVIGKLASSLGVTTDIALDLIMFLQDEHEDLARDAKLSR
jgi:hypothetical protein